MAVQPIGPIFDSSDDEIDDIGASNSKDHECSDLQTNHCLRCNVLVSENWVI